MKLSREIRIGAMFIITVAVLYWGINFLKGRDVFTTARKIYAKYPSVDGLVRSNQITINGLNIGKVSRIEFLNDTSHSMIVEMSITHNVPIPKNSIARIYSSDLLGSKAISITLGNSTDFVHDRDTILSERKASLQDEVTNQLVPLKIKAEKLMGSFDTLITSVNSVMNKESRENLIKSFAGIKKTIDNLQRSSSAVDTIVSGQKGRMSKIIANIESITTAIKGNNKQISSAIKNISTISDTLAAANLSKTIVTTQKALQNFEAITDKINKGQGSLGLLVNNDSLYHQLEGSSKSLNLLLQDMKTHPSRYVHFSVFGKKDKK
ncbi:MAG: MCE family protein [Bacteroidetes bacterium]|nr:MCE family protein [Bacteroidota bacterium]